MTTTPHRGPLQGVRVIDLTRVLAGPFTTMQLGDMGADVIKIECPTGDETRHWGPPWVNGESAYYTCVNRNKRGMVLDFKTLEAREVLKRLVTTADVVIENFKVGTMERWGLGYEDCLSKINPGLVYCSITGYGRTGPAAHLAGYDPIIEAVGGFMAINGERSGQPLKAGVAVIDLLTGLQAAFAITSALLHRRETGEGQRVDLSLFETSLAALANQASAYLMSGDVPPRYGNAHPHIVPTDVFETADGPVMVCCGNTGQFRKLCRLLGHPELAEDPRFVTNRVRVEHRDELDALLRVYLAQVSGKDLVARANEIALPVAHVLELDEVFEQPQVHARDMLLEIDHPSAGRFKQVGFPVKLGKTPSTLRRPPPRLGEHTREVLRDAGLSEDEIDEMLGAESAAVA